MSVSTQDFLYWGVALLPVAGGLIAWAAFDYVEVAAIRRRQRDRKAAIRAKNADLARKAKRVWDQDYRLNEQAFERVAATECTPRRCHCVLDQSPPTEQRNG